MASIQHMPNGKWRALVRRGGFNSCRTFAEESQAREWGALEESRLAVLSSDKDPIPTKEITRYQVAGVYMLYKDRQVVYVGRSVHIYRRLADHGRKADQWDSFRIWPCVNSIRAAELERKLIERHKPPLNIAMTEGHLVARRRKGKNKSIFTRYNPGDATAAPPSVVPFDEYEEVEEDI